MNHKKCMYTSVAGSGNCRIIQKSWGEDWILWNGYRLMISNNWDAELLGGPQNVRLPLWLVMA